ncbi:MAG TPA: peptidylprolyl isomerase [Acidobacteriaceae bacterium]|nr:peptidylprolyl isomerase [Acidobacteriaceae bacterium]
MPRSPVTIQRMFRFPIRLTLIASLSLLSVAAFAQQDVPSKPDAQAPPAAATDGTQPGAGQTSAPPNSNALPDEPGTTANVQPPVEPEGPTVVLDTTMGRMVCRLYSTEAPNTTANFVGLATGQKEWTDPATHQKVSNKPFYDGTTFHRVIPGFMIQGGDPTGTGTGDAGYFFADEISPKLTFDVPGRLAMANAGPNTNGTQFFITVAPQPSLDQHYSIFGQCDPGSVLVAQSITEVPRNDRDKPLEPVYLNKVTIVPNGQPLPALPPAAVPQPASATPPHP